MSRIRLFPVLLLVGAIFLVPLIAFAASPVATGPLTIKLDELNKSGESGTAVLTDLGGGQTKVDVTITGEPAGGSHPMHIHTGQCGPTLGGVVYPLTNVVNGTSTTTVAVALATIMDGNHAINGHKGAGADISTYVFCGNIPTSGAPAAQATGTATTSASDTPTTAATTAATDTPTTAATVAATPTTAATESATAAATAAATTTVSAAATSTSTAPSTAPTTGGDAGNMLVPALLLALLVIGLGVFVQRLATK